jgi:hypothetical protein
VALLPRTAAEQRLAVGVAITAGISEELMFRGLLIAAGVGLAGLSVAWSAVIAAVLFAVAHLYQGPSFILPALIGLTFTIVYVMSGSLLPGIVAHVAMDVAALTIPAHVIRRPAPEAVEASPEPSSVPHQGYRHRSLWNRQRRCDRPFRSPGHDIRRKSSKSKPGETTQLTRTASPDAGSADCQTPPGTSNCGRWPAATSMPRVNDRDSTGASALPPKRRVRGPPACHSHTSSERTTCHWERSPPSSKK